MSDAGGVPLSSSVTAANTHDGTVLLPLLDSFRRPRGRRGRPHTKPLVVNADKAYHSAARVEALHRRGVWPLLPQRGTGDKGLARVRWVIGRTLA